MLSLVEIHSCSMMILAQLLLILIPSGSSELKPLQGKVISGIYYEETARFVPYTKVVPLLFEFKLKPEYYAKAAPSPASSPSSSSSSSSSGFSGIAGWTVQSSGSSSSSSSSSVNNNNAFQILPRLNCRSDVRHPVLSTMDWYFTCPVMYHLHNFLDALKGNLTDIYPTPPRSPSVTTLTRALGLQDSQKWTNSKVKFDECESVVEKMWKGVTNRERDTGFAFYASIVEKCSSVPVYVEDRISDESEDYTEYFDRMQDNFVSNFFLNSSDPGELVNNLVALQGLQLQSIYSELTRIREAVLSCQNNLIPQSFVKYSRLEKALTELRPKLLKLRYSMSTQSISKLYKMPIADCIFSGNSLIVQLLVPVVRSDANFVLLKVNSPIFLYENRLCKVGLSGVMASGGHIIADDEPPAKYYLYEKNEKMVVSTECSPGDTDLCFIPDQTSRPMVNRCMTSVLNQSLVNSDDIRYYCYLQCEPQPLSESFSKLLIPVIQRISSSKFVVALNRVTSLLIKCDGQHNEMVTPQEFGAVEISLACGCYLMWHSEKFEARMPCANTVVVRHVVPEHMFNRSAIYSRNKFYFVSNLGERINSSLLSIRNNGNVVVGGAGGGEAGIMGGGNTERSPSSAFSTSDNSIYPFDNMKINETLLDTGEGVGPVGATTSSLSLANHTGVEENGMSSADADAVNGYSYYRVNCYGAAFTHTFLWIAVGIETTIFLGIAIYLYCRIYEMNKKWELRHRTSVTYSSAAQLTSVYD